MNLKIRIGVAAALLSTASSIWANPQTELAGELPVLKQESQHATAAQRVSSLFTYAHYKKIELDDGLSSSIFERFLKQLDYNRHFFLASDIKSLEKYRDQFDDMLERGRLDGAYEIFHLNMKRRLERFDYAISLLDKPMDFERKGDKFEFDREQAAWPNSVEELNELWRQRVKNDALNLKLNGKEWPEIKDLLTKRYERAIKRLSQSKSEDVFQTAMNAFARSIEAHTSYLSPRNSERFEMEMNLSFEGIGAVLSSVDDFVTVRSVVPGGPAELSNKIKPEDKIIGVAQEDGDFVDVVGWRLDEVVDLIKGPKGTVVRLQVLKEMAETNAPTIVSLTRDKIKLEDRAAKSEVYVPETGPHQGEKLGIIEIPSFYNNLSEDVKKEIASLKKQDVKGVIIDLRGNGGGSLNEATLLTGLFIDEGPVVQIRDQAGRLNVKQDRDGVTYYSGPLTVLVDRYSASASEIFAAAMQDYGRALIIGESTFGKGTVQQHRQLGRLFDLYENPLGAVQFTMAKFYRINGGSTQHKGVTPDIAFPSPIEPGDWGESQAENALPWDSIPRAKYTSVGDTKSTKQQVLTQYLERIQKNPEFAYLNEDIVRYQSEKDENTISLVESERLAEQEERKQRSLIRANERLARMGLEPVTSLEDLPEALETLDPFKQEAANITFDVISSGKYVFQR